MKNEKVEVENELIAIFGPTTTAKTGLAINLAKFVQKRFDIDAELISADSRKVYRYLNVGQSKIPDSVKEEITTHLIDVINPDKKFSLYQFKTGAEGVIRQSHKQNHLPIMFGGTGTYILSIIQNWNVPKRKYGLDFKKQFGRGEPQYRALLLSPKFKKQTLFQKIKTNVEQMFNKGLDQEFLKLADKYKVNPLETHPRFNALYVTLAYKEFIEYAQERKIGNFADFSRADIGRIKWRILRNIKDYARRQMAWYPKMEQVVWVRDFQEARKQVEKFLLERKKEIKNDSSDAFANRSDLQTRQNPASGN